MSNTAVLPTASNSPQTTQHDLQTLQAPIAAQMLALDGVIRDRLRSEVALINQVADYIIAAGGKRLRPALVIMSARALSLDESHRNSATVLDMAAAIEFVHTATLLHDDVVDESELRRGRQTANAAFGNAASVLVGDFLYSRAFQMMVNANSMAIMQVMATATNIIAEGEVLQLINIGNCDTSQQAYMQVIEYKTAKLFEAACEVGAIVAGANDQARTALAAYGRHLGVAFQIMDDVLDYAGQTQTIGKTVGDDLREGKVTLPLILAMQSDDKKLAQSVRQAIELRGDPTTQDNAFIQAVILGLHSSGVLDQSRATAQTASQQAIAALTILPQTQAKQDLINLALFASDRSY